MPHVSPYLVARAQNVISDTVPTVATIARTSASVNMRITPDTREIHVTGLPQLMRVPRWQLTFPVGTDVRPGDVVTTAGGTAYAVILEPKPGSYNTSIQAYAVLVSQSTNPKSVSFANETVTFQRLKPDGSAYDQITGIGVYIEQMSTEPRMDPFGALVGWRVYFQNSLTINGLPLQADDQIVWSGTHRGFAVLERPQQLYGPLPYAVAVFRESV